MIKQYCTGLQHIGIPTNTYEKTKQFYESLGFTTALETSQPSGAGNVVFLQLHNLVLEIYKVESPAKESGAIDHFAIDVTDVQKVYEYVKEKEYTVLEEGELPFWENGVRYFTIEGPNGEKVEFSQKLCRRN